MDVFWQFDLGIHFNTVALIGNIFTDGYLLKWSNMVTNVRGYLRCLSANFLNYTIDLVCRLNTIGKFRYFLGSAQKTFLHLFWYFAIFGCKLFRQIDIKISKSYFSWFLYQRLDLRWFQGCLTFTFLFRM